ncbi:MAG: tRNA threonylcarbamoyladenosine biosynthesis protein TsaE [Phycisphaerae bacterium]|nr:tRNA threonylcarbamoyladenosine biosynthesis protein TsaE [Phycisphaerae bacterium]
MTTWSCETSSVEETVALGRRIGQSLVGNAVVALVGPLGAGKTHLVKGIAAGNGLPDPGAVTSPTFVLVNEYEGRLRLRHLDLYRVRSIRELFALGFEEMREAGGAVVVEWADRFPEAMPVETLWITITPQASEGGRQFEFRANDAAAGLILRAVAGGS